MKAILQGMWGQMIDAVIIVCFTALFMHHDISREVFFAVVLPLVGARIASLKNKNGGGGSGAVALATGLLFLVGVHLSSEATT